jgi:hypothetical protein
VSGDVHFALAKESFFTAVFGIVCLASLLAPRPLLFYTGRSFVAAGDPARAAAFSDRWQYAGFRHVMRIMTIVWGVAFLAEAGVRVALVYALPVNAALVASPLLAAGVFGALMVWTIRFGNAAQAAALRRNAAALPLESLQSQAQDRTIVENRRELPREARDIGMAPYQGQTTLIASTTPSSVINSRGKLPINCS